MKGKQQRDLACVVIVRVLQALNKCPVPQQGRVSQDFVDATLLLGRKRVDVLDVEPAPSAVRRDGHGTEVVLHFGLVGTEVGVDVEVGVV